MARQRKYKTLVCDFETTVYPGQKSTEVWASAVVEIGSEDVNILHSIDETFSYFKSLKTNLICYYHNLKFDGSFWLSYLLKDTNLKQATYKIGLQEYDLKFREIPKMENNTYTYAISDMGLWYKIVIKVNDYIIEIRDSLKLLPFSVEKIGKSFGTKHKKLEMEYEGFRYAGCEITDDEKEYIANDVLVVKEALEIMFSENHNKLTIGACCLSEYKAIVGKEFVKAFMPDLTEFLIDPKKHVFKNTEEWLRKTYKGGWTYLVPEKANKVFKKGLTVDVNSLYPSMMHSESGSKYPVGPPRFWTGSTLPEEVGKEDYYYFIHVKTRFYLKEGFLPFIQIKGSFLYKSTEILSSSDVVNSKTGVKSSTYFDAEGVEHDTRVDLYFTETEYQLFLDHYDTVDFEIIDGCFFRSMIGIFDEYIDKYKQIKVTTKGAKKELAKLFLNNLYGKMATSTDSSFKYAYLKEDGSVGFVGIDEADKKPGYIACGSAITGYTRNFTIRHAQMNYHGSAQGFIYADTDSLHCDLDIPQLVDIKQHPTDFNTWKIESEWDEAIFVRSKTYIEHVVKEDGELIEKPYYNVKCAGMPDRCKKQFVYSIDPDTKNTDQFKKDCANYNEEQKKFVNTVRDITDFKIGLKIFGKLTPKRIKGGVLLTESYYEMRWNNRKMEVLQNEKSV